jgi:hypothetical protein
VRGVRQMSGDNWSRIMLWGVALILAAIALTQL